ncbi:hypothetical protein ACGC1H_003488 [Rhizoctonia solani]
MSVILVTHHSLHVLDEHVGCPSIFANLAHMDLLRAGTLHESLGFIHTLWLHYRRLALSPSGTIASGHYIPSGHTICPRALSPLGLPFFHPICALFATCHYMPPWAIPYAFGLYRLWGLFSPLCALFLPFGTIYPFGSYHMPPWALSFPFGGSCLCADRFSYPSGDPCLRTGLSCSIFITRRGSYPGVDHYLFILFYFTFEEILVRVQDGFIYFLLGNTRPIAGQFILHVYLVRRLT